MPKLLSTEQVDRFHRDGYLAPLRMVSDDSAREMRRQLEAFEAERGGPLKGPVRFKSHLLFKWLNRKSQRKAYTWAQFVQALAWVGWPEPRVRKDLNPFRRAEAH